MYGICVGTGTVLEPLTGDCFGCGGETAGAGGGVRGGGCT